MLGCNHCFCCNDLGYKYYDGDIINSCYVNSGEMRGLVIAKKCAQKNELPRLQNGSITVRWAKNSATTVTNHTDAKGYEQGNGRSRH